MRPFTWGSPSSTQKRGVEQHESNNANVLMLSSLPMNGRKPLTFPKADVPSYGVRPQTVPWPGCLCPIFLVPAILRDTSPASSELLRVYALKDSGYFHLHSLWIPRCDTSLPVASVVAEPIHIEWRTTKLASPPVFATTWRSAARASVYFHPFTSLPSQYDDKEGGALRQCRLVR